MTAIISKAGHAATALFVGYVALGASWALGAPGFPWGASDPDPDGQGSLLAWLSPDPGGWWIAAFALVCAATSMALLRSRGRLPLLVAWPLAGFLVLVLPDSRLMMGVAYTPLLSVTAFLDGPWGEVGLGDVWQWPVLNQLLCALGGALLAAAAVSAQRRRRDGCAACGRTEAGVGWTTPAAAARWGRTAVAIAVATPLFYCATRWAWALGIPFGVSEGFLEEGNRDAPGIWLAGAYLATFGALGGVLTLGLVQRWGEVFPRWMLGLRGRRVPPLLAIIPATLVAAIITEAGLTYIRRAVTGAFELSEWGAWLPECFWPVWGVALAAAALAYGLRRRGRCAHCGRGAVAAAQSTMAM
ncbi:hypothetical protein AB0B45_29500 [Nonomuraea sp. NPDC049152]|uniref:hypothetical protein n=1 Tax=Nonomuraea sp. NPDC049152 TaxID=3154350 RepID=UPI0033C74AA2